MSDPALASAFEKAFADALAGHTPAPPPPAEHLAAMGIEPQTLFGKSPAKVVGNFCTLWPMVKGFIQLASSVLGWFQPAAAAAAAAFIVAFEATALPTICPTPPAE